MPTTIDAGLIQALIAVVIFGFGMLVSWLAFLTLRQYRYAIPAYKRLTGDDDLEQQGHIAESGDRFDELEEAHTNLALRVDDIHTDVNRIDRRQEVVLTNQASIAEGVGVSLERQEFYRGGGRPSSDDD